MKQLLLFYALCLMVGACSTVVPTTQKTTTLLPQKVPLVYIEKDAPQILFITFQLSKDSLTKTPTAMIIKTQFAEGRLKKDYQLEHQLVPNHLRCSFLDENKNPIKYAVVESPLKKRVEYIDATGELSSKWIEPPKGSFFIRTQWNPNIYYLNIEEISEQLTPQLIATFFLSKS